MGCLMHSRHARLPPRNNLAMNCRFSLMRAVSHRLKSSMWLVLFAIAVENSNLEGEYTLKLKATDGTVLKKCKFKKVPPHGLCCCLTMITH